MRLPSGVTLARVLSLLLLAGLAGAAPPSPTDTAESLDRERIQAHLSGVEALLRQRDVAGLDPAQRRERTRNLDRLREYWQRGVFPRNHQFPGQRVPYFIDATGRACAVGHLMLESGGGETARAIAARENNARVAEITHPGAARWIAQSGLTADECALIQPSYCFACDNRDEPVCGVDGRSYQNACKARECMGVQVACKGSCPGGNAFDGGTFDDGGVYLCPGPSKVQAGGCGGRALADAGRGARGGSSGATLLAGAILLVLLARRRS